MKKYFIIAVAAMAAMAACTKTQIDETVIPDQKIDFTVANYSAQTKAGNVALTNDQDGLYKFHTVANQFPKLGSPVEFMDTDVFAWDNAATPAKVTTGTSIYMWAPEGDYYWPKTGYINFYSYAGTIDPAVDNTAADKKTVKLTYADKTIQYDSNILVADAALRFNANQETYAVDGTENPGHVTKGVPTLFRHMLAKLYVDVKIKTASAASSTTIWKVQVLDNYDINGDNSTADGEKSLIIPVNKGTLTLTNADALATDAALNTTTQTWVRKADYTTENTADADVVSGWKPGNTSENIQLHQATVLTMPVNTTESSSTEQLLAWRTVMPQLTDNVALQLVYKVQAYHIVNNAESLFMEEIRTVGVTLNGDNAADIHDLTGSIAQWESNKKITYHIIIDPVSQKVTFDPAVEDYDAVEANSNSTINVNNGGLVVNP